MQEIIFVKHNSENKHSHEKNWKKYFFRICRTKCNEGANFVRALTLLRQRDRTRRVHPPEYMYSLLSYLAIHKFMQRKIAMSQPYDVSTVTFETAVKIHTLYLFRSLTFWLWICVAARMFFSSQNGEECSDVTFVTTNFTENIISRRKS